LWGGVGVRMRGWVGVDGDDGLGWRVVGDDGEK